MTCLLTQAVRAFQNLERPVEHWGDWFVQLIIYKLDSTSRMLWESSLKNQKYFPTYDQLLEFLKGRSRSLSAATIDSTSSAHSQSSTNAFQKKVTSCVTSVDSKPSRSSCKLCEDSHFLAYCSKFRNMALAKRREFLRSNHLCFNCLRSGHLITSCASLGRCQHCHRKHHSLVHYNKEKPTENSKPSASEDNHTVVTGEHGAVTSNVISLSCNNQSSVFLATAKVYLENAQGQCVLVRALLDSGSQATFISEKLVQLLKLPKIRTHVPVKGLQGSSTGLASSQVSVTLRSHDLSSANVRLKQVLVLPHLTVSSTTTQDFLSWQYIKNLKLADPEFYKGSPIDLIIGADIYGLLLQGGIIHGLPGTLTAQQTSLGWVIMGSSINYSTNTTVEQVVNYHITTSMELEQSLQRFWEENKISSERIPTPEEVRCEDIFKTTHQRDETGRYIVRLPIKENALSTLGHSRNSALSQFLSLETRLNRNLELKQKYADFLQDYLDQGHMQEASPPADSDIVYYLPHHPVIKTHNNITKKIRVVCPRLQRDLWLILTRWRLWQFVFTADIVQMFRQIMIHESDRNLQRILWRFNSDEEIKEYLLNTVTYGTTSAPYLAIRSFDQLSEDERESCPHGAKALDEHTFVDDIHGGGDTVEEAQRMRQQLVEILAAGGFTLSKWAANESTLNPASTNTERLISEHSNLSTLGILWMPNLDSFQLRLASISSIDQPTKRSVLSDIAKFFDPLGWAAPVLIYGKVFMQTLWKHKLSWDETLPDELREQWSSFATTLPELNQINVPRFLRFSRANCIARLIGFCDASERAYSAVVYLRCEFGHSIHTNLIISKTRVAPISVTSVPRLELCGAVLLAKLIKAVYLGLNLETASRYLWTDAQVVLVWLSAHPSKWTPYVAHRVSTVLEISCADSWRYVNTNSNPADLATRGITPSELSKAALWWHWPDWLTLPIDKWPRKDIPQHTEMERSSTSAFVSNTIANDTLLRFSSYTRLIRVSALCLRFFHNCKYSLNKRVGNLSCDEIKVARRRWLSIVQWQDFPDDITALKNREALPRRSKLISLRPFIGLDGLLRVGGRLQNAQLSAEERHPLILHKSNHLSALLTQQAHFSSLHGGPQLMRVILSNYWIIGGLSLAKQIYRNCVRCARFKATNNYQQMGQLPVERVQPSRPFTAAGIDYAGPFALLAFRGRGSKTHKTYVALFVCFATRAIHLELVYDLTAEAFVAAFRRFVSRRGHCKTLFSDNATTFRGADRDLKAMFKEASTFYEEAMVSLTNMDTTWKFIPPRAPHFGGLWEAGVKSIKYHLRRVVGDQHLSLEEMNTLLCQIEACVNSRPLCPISDNISDFSALTPGHFLVGEPLTNIPEKDYSDMDERHPLARWQHLSAVRDHFWKRWSTEYLQQLQQLQKWHRPRKNSCVGQLVLIINNLQPPAKWLLGRVLEVHPGPDQLIRVLTIRTATGVLKRPITKICMLSLIHEPQINGTPL